jgi:hypothetical protein
MSKCYLNNSNNTNKYKGYSPFSYKLQPFTTSLSYAAPSQSLHAHPDLAEWG